MRKDTTSTTGRQQIDPEKNFLLSRARQLSSRKDEISNRTLYKLHNGIYAVHVQYDEKSLRSDELVKIDQEKANFEFSISPIKIHNPPVL